MNCKLETRYICKNYAQMSCPFFKSLGGMTTTTCDNGLPDRVCQSKEARKEALISYLEKLNEQNTLPIMQDDKS
jgi:hypothetical protein